MDTRYHLVWAAVFQLLKKTTTSALSHSSKSSICASFAHHFLAFSGLFQDSLRTIIAARSFKVKMYEHSFRFTNNRIGLLENDLSCKALVPLPRHMKDIFPRHREENVTLF